MTTSVKVSAHCASTVQVEVKLNGEPLAVLQGGEVYETVVYDSREVTVKEVQKQ